MILVFVTVLGLAFGSFVNALVWRMHETSRKTKKSSKEDLSIINGRSICPSCRHQLAAQDLIPIFSWIFLGGRCRYCKKPISWRYPLVELITSVLFFVAYCVWPYELDGALQLVNFGIFLAIIVVGVALSVYDLKWMILPNRLVYSLAALSILWLLTLSISESNVSLLVSAIIGSIGFGGFFFVLYQISKGKWIGGGDVRLGFILGLLLGWQYSILGLTIAAYLATAVVLTLILMGKYHKKMHIPFGPFLLLGAYASVIWGRAIVDWYLRLSGAV